MHEAVLDWVEQVAGRFGLLDVDVLDLGGRDVNGSVRHLFEGDYVTVDIAEHPTVDVVADAATLDLPDRFDVVICTEVLEHTPSGREITATAFRHLRDGGVFIATMAGPGRSPHGASGEPRPPDGEWYRNVTSAELTSWLTEAGFGMWQLDEAGTDLRCWARR